jgi:hypothetical protein
MMIERRSQIPLDEFQSRYRAGRRPVIITHLLPPDWPALQKWNLSYLKQLCGDAEVEVLADRAKNANYETSYDQHRRKMSFGDYIDWVEANPRSNDIYIHAQNGFMNTSVGQRLFPDMPAFEYLEPDRAVGNTFFWFGPADTVTPLHHDNDDIMFVQVYGRKQWALVSPRQGHLLYMKNDVFSNIDAETPDLDAHPLTRFADASRFVLNPGEALFLPTPWYHYVKALDVSVSLSFTNFRPI